MKLFDLHGRNCPSASAVLRLQGPQRWLWSPPLGLSSALWLRPECWQGDREAGEIRECSGVTARRTREIAAGEMRAGSG